MRSQFNRKLGRFVLATGRKVYPLISAFYNLLLLPVLLVAGLAKLLLGVPLNQPVFDDDEDVKKAWNDNRWGKHGFIKANGINFHYVESGPKDAPLMLFLHGFPECWYSWREQLHTIGKTGQYHCVAIDLRGYGLTDKPQGIHNYSIEALVADVEGVIDAFVTKHNKREKKAAVVAHDWGGWLAWHAGHMIPHKMSSLCIMNSPHPLLFERNSSITQFFRFWYMYFFQLPYISELILSSFGYWGIGFAFTGPLTGVKDYTHMTETDVKVFKYAFSRPNGPSAVLNYFRNSVRKSPEDIAKILCRPIPSDLPLVVLWGQFDGALGRELIDEDLDVVVRPKLAPTFFDASHWLQHERPHEVNAHLLAFLAEHGLASVESMAAVDESDDKTASDIVNVITAETEPVGSDEKLLADPDAGDDLPAPSLADISQMFKSEADAP